MFLPAFVPGYVKQLTSVMMQQKLGNKYLCKFSTQCEKSESSQVDNESLWGTLL